MNLFKLVATVGLDTSEYEKGVKQATADGKGLAHTLQHGLGGAAKAGGRALAKAAKVTVEGVTVATGAVTALVGKATKEFADYEQLVGGVDTLFKNSSKKVQDYAAKAYKTAGMSANKYMDTVTSFAASLLQSLEGDTEAAADAADMAIQDMADNANKMGTAIESIEDAYKGFAKGNFTMLDNLKLGYGGTAREMARLVNDSGVLGDAYIDLADKQNLGAALQEVGFAKIVQAIHKVQENTGIMGTTAAEAEKTISGSVASAKASFDDLMVGVATNADDLDERIDHFVDSVGTAKDNILPVVETTLTTSIRLAERYGPELAAKIPQFLDETLPKILEYGADVIDYIVDGIYNHSDHIDEGVQKILTTLGDKIEDHGPEWLVKGSIILGKVVAGFIEAVPKILDEESMRTFARGLRDAIFAHEDEYKDIGFRIARVIKDAFMADWNDFWDGVKGWVGTWGDLGNFGPDGPRDPYKPPPKGNPTPTNGGSGGRRPSGHTPVSVDGSFASGLDYVPWDGFIAELHKGERVQTAEEASRPPVTIVQNIYSTTGTAADQQEEARYRAEEALFTGV